jgi:hypothetical protein
LRQKKSSGSVSESYDPSPSQIIAGRVGQSRSLTTDGWEHLRDVREEPGRTKRDEKVQKRGISKGALRRYGTTGAWYSFVRSSFSSSHIQTVESRHELNLFLVGHYLCTAAPTRCGPCKGHLKRATKWVESETFGHGLPCVSAPFDQALDS